MYGDLFNDVLGPIMTGPSSSATSGITRFARLARGICGEPIKRATIYMNPDSALYLCLQGLNSDKAFASGLMGWEPEDPRTFDALDIARETGMEIVFTTIDENFEHFNAGYIKCEGISGRKVTVRGASIGGGSVHVDRIDDLDVDITGGKYELLVCGSPEAFQRVSALVCAQPSAQNGAQALYSLVTPPDLEELRSIPGVIRAITAEPVLPTVINEDVVPPFTTATGLTEWLKEHPMSLSEAMLVYQQALSGWERERILDRLSHIVDVMNDSWRAGLESDGRGFTFLKPRAAQVEALRASGKFLPTGILDLATVAATSVMENNCSMKIVVAAPTAGSAGVIPGVIAALEQVPGITREDILRGMLAAGFIGVAIFNQATFGAFAAGCAVEVASGSAMAAAMAAEAMGCEPDVCLRAAGLAIQNLIGLACDHIAAGVEVPCISRNPMASANAIVCANLAMGGFDPYIPLDETISAMYEAGKFTVNQVHKCGIYGRFGLAGTKSGIEIRRRIDEDRKRHRN